MKCPADLVTACDKQPECDCGFCFEHCCCPQIQDDFDEGEARAEGDLNESP